MPTEVKMGEKKREGGQVSLKPHEAVCACSGCRFHAEPQTDTAAVFAWHPWEGFQEKA